jgi:hypothetical protein
MLTLVVCIYMGRWDCAMIKKKLISLLTLVVLYIYGAL